MSAAQGRVSGMPVGGTAGLCSCGLAPQPDLRPYLVFDAFPTTELRLPLSPSPPSQLTFTRPPCRPRYRDGRLYMRTSPQVLEPFPPSKRNLLVALCQDTAVTNSSLRLGTRCFLFCALYLPEISRVFFVCLFLIERWMY